MNPEPGEVAQERVAVSGERALEEVQALVALGLRDSGTPGAERAAHHLRERFHALGVEAEIQEFRAKTPAGEMAFRNVIGRIPGTGEGIVLLGSHYDTKTGMPEGFQGANDSGSSTGLLLELARGVGPGAAPPRGLGRGHLDGEGAR